MTLSSTHTLSSSSTRSNLNTDKFILVLAFAGVYILWGTTYLAMSTLVKTVPMFLMAAFRFLFAGSIMLAWAFWVNHERPSRKQITKSSILGLLLLVGGNGGVLIANKFIASSGVIAVLVAATPLWIAFLQWLLGTSEKLTPSVWIGIFLGIAGMTILSGSENLKSLGNDSLWGIGALVLSSISWATGTVYGSTGKTPSSPLFNSSIQMLFASFCMFLIATGHQEWGTIDLGKYGWIELGSFLYLVIGGSVLGFTSYTYLTKNASTTSASTYAYVNPVIALFLGWWLGNELITQQTILASLILLAAVVLIVVKPKMSKKTLQIGLGEWEKARYWKL